MPERPQCPICRHTHTILMATLKGERTVDIYLCQRCRGNFSLERVTNDSGTTEPLHTHRGEPTEKEEQKWRRSGPHQNGNG